MLKIGEKFSIEDLQDFDKIIEEIYFLPEPETAHHDNPPSEEINKTNTVLCLQRDIVLFKTGANIRYIGTKYLDTCIFAYIYNETDQVGVHVDGDCKLNLFNIFSKFQSKENITVTLIGGNLANAAISNQALPVIIEALFEASRHFNITLTISQQKILKNNQFTENCKYQFLFDTLFRKAEILWKHLFNEKFPREAFKNCKVSDFYTKKIDLSAKDLSPMLTNLLSAQELSTQEEEKRYSELRIAYKKHSAPIEKIKEAFIQKIINCFCIASFNLMKNEMSQQNCPQRMLENFVIDINHKKIHIINRNTETPNENITWLLLINSWDTMNLDYSLAYDGYSGGWVERKLSKEFVTSQ